MIDPAPSWYPDPAGRHELRYWDGSQWTHHIVSAGRTGTDPLMSGPPATGSIQASRRHTRRIGVIGVLLCLVAVVAVAAPAVSYIRASSEKSVTLDQRDQDVSLPPNKPYGIYIDDADNSGFTYRCSVKDAAGRDVPVSNYPPGRITSSDTEMLDTTFNSGSGELTINCLVRGERVSVRPAPAQRPLVFGVIAGGIAGTLGAGLLISWLAQRPWRRPRIVSN